MLKIKELFRFFVKPVILYYARVYSRMITIFFYWHVFT